MRMMGPGAVDYENRRHFFFAASRAMRDLIAEQARRQARRKRDGGRRVTLHTGDLVDESRPASLIDLHAALGRLERQHPAWAQVVLLRFYGGLSSEESAETIGVSLRTVERRWTCAKALLRRELAQGSGAVEPV
jgi:RNA polymerase sigma factor (TIGR02999 family)